MLPNIAAVGGPLAPRDHRSDEVLPRAKAREEHAGNMRDDTRRREIGKQAMQMIHGVRSPKGIGGQENAGNADARHQRQQEHDHGSPGWIMSNVARFPSVQDELQICGDCLRSHHERCKARVSRPDKAPKYPKPYEPERGPTGRKMNIAPVFSREVRHGKSRDETPVEETNEWVPDLNFHGAFRRRPRRSPG
jgi:hypothetical protein